MNKAFSIMLLAIAMMVGCDNVAQSSPGSANAPPPAPVATDPAGAAAADDQAEHPHAKLLDPNHERFRQQAPESFRVKFHTSKGDFIVLVQRSWAPHGADRFYNLVRNGFYDDVRFFRVIDGFMAQFGIHGNPKVSAVWRNARIADDPVVKSNTRGTVSFATAGPNTRTTQVFINFKNNAFLDQSGFSPIGIVVEGMNVVDSLYKEYGEGAPQGRGPSQQLIQTRGNEYLQAEFPKLDHVITARVIEPGEDAEGENEAAPQP